ncbi:type-4 ice-structuring protein-like [Brachyistius frenatus]|uniref:type-4 ice-structuring protein-like n=1 Tax=Brachyistius frenatus TaxID=100188 RepID=UPI0037E889FB
MKFSIVAALVVVLAITNGSEAGSLVKREVQAEVDKITQLFNDMSASITSTTQDMVEKMKTMEMGNTAQTYMANGKAKLQPLMEKLQAEAAKLQEQVQPLIGNIEVKSLTDMMEKFFQQVMDQTKALMPPQ